jgi:hypothetical protein
MGKNLFRILGIVGCIILAAIIGWYALKFAMAILAFLIFACGAAVGFGIARLFPSKKKINP